MMNRKLWLPALLYILLLSACADRTASQRALVDPVGTPAAPAPARPAGAGENPPAAAAEEGTAVAMPTVTAAPQPTATAVPGREIVLCMSGPPRNLYLYGDDSPAALGLRHAIYESLFTTTGYSYKPQGLVAIPSLTNGDARLEPVTVSRGDQVVDVDGRVVALREGVRVLDQAGEEVAFRGDPITMEQLVVDFEFQPMVWSDGTPVTAADSLFSFNVAADPGTAVGKARVATTSSYEVTGSRSVRWTGLPGFRDQAYFTNVWTPLPVHQLGDFAAADLLTVGEAARLPLSSGPFVVASWEDTNELHLVRNPHYYQDGLPRLDGITVRFGAGDDFLTGGPDSGCDVVTGEALSAANLTLLEAAMDGDAWQIESAPGDVFEQIVFGISPSDIYGADRPDWFGDVRVRQALTQCVDRERLIAELTAGRATLLNSYVPPDHPLAPTDLRAWPYDPAAANALLEDAGFRDYAGDGRRQDVTTGRPMTITLGTNSESTLRLQITQLVQEDLAGCGIPVTLYDLPAGSWYGAGPEGPVFGRKFDLAEMAWVGRVLPDCGLYLSSAIPGPERDGYTGWRGANVSGWSSEAFDAACTAALRTMPGGPGYAEAQQEALRIFNEELPVMPLFTNVKVAVARPSVQNLHLDPSQPSLLWNVQEWDVLPQ